VPAGQTVKTNKSKATPPLRFTPTAWAKLLWLRDRGDTEIGGFGIASDDDPLIIEQFVMVSQYTSSASVEFDDQAVAEFFEDQFEQGRRPEQFARLWIHTHPGDSPHPSQLDEATFERVFGPCDWAVMAIVARGGDTYARLRFNVGPGGECEIPIEIAWDQPFEAAEPEAWEAEYLANVQPITVASGVGGDATTELPFGPEWYDDPTWLEPYSIDPEVLDQLDQVDPVDQQSLTTSIAFGIGASENNEDAPDIEGIDLEF
jgi:proteasome lid subunit RPN8/RPN11